MRSVLLHRSRADTLDFAPGKGRLHQVRGIQAALAVTRADHRMDFVDEQNQVGVRLGFREQAFQPLLELSPIFSSGH